MSLKIGGSDPAKIMVGDTPASKIMSGDQIVWQAIRKITMTATHESFADRYVWNFATAVGDTDLMVYTSSANVSFSVPMTCSRTVNRGIGTISAGVVIPAGTYITARTTQSHVFTEVIP